MRKVITAFAFLLLQHFCFAQNRIMDSLKTELANAKSDTARLNTYIALSEASSKKNKLMYTEPAFQLVDKLLLQEKNIEKKQKLIDQETFLVGSLGFHYRYSSSREWDKAMAYLEDRLQHIEKSGDKERTAAFLFSVAGTALDENKDSSLFSAYMNRSISISTEIKDTVLMVNGYGFMASFYTSAGNFSGALNAVQSSIAACRQMHYNKGLVQSQQQLGYLYTEFNEPELALENLQTALSLAYQIKDTEEICSSLNSLGSFYGKQKNISKALEYFERLLKLSDNYKNSPFVPGEVLAIIGNLYYRNKDYQKALPYYEEAEKKATSRVYFAVWLGETGNIYNAMTDYEKAKAFHAKAVAIMDSLEDPFKYQSLLTHYLAKDYYGLKDYKKAKELNDDALVKYKNEWYDLSSTIEIEQLAMQIDSARGDGFGALAHYKELTALKEKNKGNEINKEAQKEKFRNEIEKQKAEQQKKDAINERTRILLYILIGTFLLFGLFLLYAYLQKNKGKKQIEKAYTDLKSTQQQLIHSEKMASLGELTAGIAHEIQNPLNFVNNFSDVNKELLVELKDEIKKGNLDEVTAIADDVISNEEKINHHGKRADAIVKGMLQHSRSSSGVKEPTDINTLCDEYLRLSYHGLRAKDKSFNATMKTDFDNNIGNINIIPQDIGRVVLNLINNAFYAVDDKKKSGIENYEPTIWVSTKKQNGKIEINVKDNGNGIPESIKEKIFQPFFTTKPTGQGTGLGLSLSYDIVKAHGGELKVETTEGEGTEFIILLINKNYA